MKVWQRQRDIAAVQVPSNSLSTCSHRLCSCPQQALLRVGGACWGFPRTL